MKKLTITAVVAILALVTAIAGSTYKAADKSKTTVIETTNLCQAKGYRGKTPVKVIISNDKVVSVEALPNQETPRFFQRVKDNLLPKYKGVSVKKAIGMTSQPVPDGCTGATYSSRAVQQNIKSALDKYQRK